MYIRRTRAKGTRMKTSTLCEGRHRQSDHLSCVAILLPARRDPHGANGQEIRVWRDLAVQQNDLRLCLPKLTKCGKSFYRYHYTEAS